MSEKFKFDFSKPEDQEIFENKPEEEKKKIIDQAHIEASALRLDTKARTFHQKDSFSADEYEESFEKIEKAKQAALEIEKNLTPEAIEKIMGKVADMDQKSLAYSALGHNSLYAVFKNGLLGRTTFPTEGESIKERWIDGTKQVRKERRNLEFDDSLFLYERKKYLPVWFNIVGRGADTHKRHYPNEREIKISHWSSKSDYTVLFDLSSFKEIPLKEKLSFHTYKNADGAEDIGKYANTDNGFILSTRVPPRLFSGIAFRLETGTELKPGQESNDDIEEWITETIDVKREEMKKKGANDSEIKEMEIQTREKMMQRVIRQVKSVHYEYPPRRSAMVWLPIINNKKLMLLRINEILTAQKEAFGNNINAYIPIYDLDGNLCWPKKMSYEEVKKFVVERNASDKNI